jgi:hypothetical protein
MDASGEFTASLSKAAATEDCSALLALVSIVALQSQALEKTSTLALKLFGAPFALRWHSAHFSEYPFICLDSLSFVPVTPLRTPERSNEPETDTLASGGSKPYFCIRL